MPVNQILESYSFTEEDINLITFALRRLSEKTMFQLLQNDCDNLIEYIERQVKEKKQLA